MTDALRHRGPDGEGQFVDGALGLGHRRLAIIDLSSAAAQPMLWITASGDGRSSTSHLQRCEVYNFRTLRRRAGGVRPDASRSHSDNGEVYNFRTLRRELEEPWPAFPVALRHGGRSGGPGAVGRGRPFPLQRHVRVRALGPAGARAVAGAGPLRREAALLRACRQRLALRLRDQGAAPASRPRRRGRFRRHGGILHIPELLLGAHALRWHLHAARRLPPAYPPGSSTRDAPDRALLGLRLLRARDGGGRGRVRGGARLPVPAGGRAAARVRRGGRRLSQRRHRFRLHHGRRRPAVSRRSRASRSDSTCLRRPRAWNNSTTSARTPRDCRASAPPSITRWCSRRATWSAASAIWSGTWRSRASASPTPTTTRRGSRAVSAR